MDWADGSSRPTPWITVVAPVSGTNSVLVRVVAADGTVVATSTRAYASSEEATTFLAFAARQRLTPYVGFAEAAVDSEDSDDTAFAATIATAFGGQLVSEPLRQWQDAWDVADTLLAVLTAR